MYTCRSRPLLACTEFTLRAQLAGRCPASAEVGEGTQKVDPIHHRERPQTRVQGHVWGRRPAGQLVVCRPAVRRCRLRRLAEPRRRVAGSSPAGRPAGKALGRAVGGGGEGRGPRARLSRVARAAGAVEGGRGRELAAAQVRRAHELNWRVKVAYVPSSMNPSRPLHSLPKPFPAQPLHPAYDYSHDLSSNLFIKARTTRR